MIIRIFRVRVASGREQDWQERVERLSIPWLKSLPGLVAYFPGRPTFGNGERIFTMVMLFDSMAAIQAALGEAWRDPVLLGDEAALVQSATVEHFEQFG